MSTYFPKLLALETLTGILVGDLSRLVGEEVDHQMAEFLFNNLLRHERVCNIWDPGFFIWKMGVKVTKLNKRLNQSMAGLPHKS